METKVDTAIENYFNMKMKYEKQYEQAKRRIIGGDLSLREKRLRLKKLKPKCLVCKRSVGMLFYIENNGKTRKYCQNVSVQRPKKTKEPACRSYWR